MSVKLRFFVALIIFSFLSFLFGLSVFRHISFGGPALKGYEIQIINLSEILPNIYHLIINQSFVEGLFVTNKNTFKKDKFNVPGLYCYLTKDGWVILDKSESTETIIPIEWEKIKDIYYKNCTKKPCINSKFAAAPINPLKIKDYIVFHLGGVLFKYNLKNKEFIAFKGHYHHSIEPFQDSLVYVCSYGTDTLDIINDEISLINILTEKVIYKKSIPNILLNSKLKSILLGLNNITITNKDLIHVNDIQPVRINTNFAEVGDLFLSFRHLSTVILY